MKEQKDSELKPNSLLKLWSSLSAHERNQANQIFNQKQNSSSQSLSSHNASTGQNNSQKEVKNPTDIDPSIKEKYSFEKKYHQKVSSKQINGMQIESTAYQFLFGSSQLSIPLRMNLITLKSFSKFPYKMSFSQLNQFGTFQTISFTQGNIDSPASKYDILQIFQHAEESRLEQITLKLPKFCKIFTVISSVRFPCLKKLYLSKYFSMKDYCEITSIEPLTWMEFPSLTHLNLEWNLISSMDSLAKTYFEKGCFSFLWLNNNLIKRFDKLTRINIKKLQSCRTDSIPTNIEYSRQGLRIMSFNSQSEDISFLVKKPFETKSMSKYLLMKEIVNRSRICQRQVLNCIYRMDRLMYLSK